MPKTIPGELVSPAEAAALFWRTDCETIRRASNIKNEFTRINQKLLKRDPNWFSCCLAACIWNAGRVQGIREERKGLREKGLK